MSFLLTGSRALTMVHLSKVTDLISAPNARRFCTEYLGIDSSKHSILSANANYVHHDTMCACLEDWKNRMEGDEKDPYSEMYTILKNVQQTKGWFSWQDLNFVFEDDACE